MVEFEKDLIQFHAPTYGHSFQGQLIDRPVTRGVSVTGVPGRGAWVSDWCGGNLCHGAGESSGRTVIIIKVNESFG